MSNVLIINPILYTAETNEIPKVDSFAPSTQPRPKTLAILKLEDFL